MGAERLLAGDTSGRSQAWHFPSGFLWGAATSSHQVEGGNRWNDWWEYEQLGRLPHRSGEACRHYEMYEQDFDLARSWGHNAHRFSIEWSRIEPSAGKWNRDAIAHYQAVIQALKKRGLEPVITLHHFTNPAWFARAGGWLRRDSPTLFARYVAHVVEHLGKEVKYWLTINEPTVYVMQGYINGEWPPCSKARWINAIIAFRNLARAHVAAYRELHRIRQDTMVAFAHSAPLVVPCDSARQRDRMAATLRDIILNHAFFYLLRAPLQNPRRRSLYLDFVAINYYTRSIIRSVGWGANALLGQVCHLSRHNHHGAMSDIGWEIYPRGLQIVLERFSRYGLPLFVTENGVATNDEALRWDFINQHLQSLARAIEGGVNVIGYLYWTLMDNYEWTMGMEPHFGLAAVDHATQLRRARPCVQQFKRICFENSLNERGIVSDDETPHEQYPQHSSVRSYP
jgi:beta-glucosidase